MFKIKKIYTYFFLEIRFLKYLKKVIIFINVFLKLNKKLI
jgi:hypothetical protein